MAEMTDVRHSVRAKRIGLFAPIPYIGVSHSIISTAEIFAEHGCEVDVFTSKQKIGKGFLPKDILLLERPENRWRKPFPVNLIYSVIWSLKMCHGKRYKCFIGYDPPGLIEACLVGLIYKVPVIYHSLELWCSNDIPKRWYHFRLLPSPEMILKHAERFFHRGVEFTIIQDKRRAKILYDDNHLSPGETYYVPHTGRERVYKPHSKPDYLKHKFSIDQQKKILLMIGGINHTTLAREIAVAVGNWPSSWHLVIHGFSIPDYLDEISQSIDSDRVTLSTELVPMAELEILIASADIGLALYQDSDTNTYEMTSGKIGQYLRCGLPVIANDFPNLVDIVEGSGAGLCVHSMDDIPEAINDILKDYGKFSQNAYKAYLEYYNFDGAFEPVLRRIKEI